MLDATDFSLPSSPNARPCRTGEPLFHQLPPVYQLVSRGPGRLNTVHVSEARLYLDDVSGRRANPLADNGGTDCTPA